MIEPLHGIIAIVWVSLVRILNLPSLDRSVGRDSKYPLTQSVGRENLSGCHLAPRGLRPLGARWHPSRFSLPLSFVCGYSRISPSLTLSFREDLQILTGSPPSITLFLLIAFPPGCGWPTSIVRSIGDPTRRSAGATGAKASSKRRSLRTTAGRAGRGSAEIAQGLRGLA